MISHEHAEALRRWLGDPANPERWQPALRSCGLAVVPPRVAIRGSWWAPAGRTRHTPDAVLDAQTGFPLLYRRYADGAFMHLVPLPKGDPILVDRWPVSLRMYQLHDRTFTHYGPPRGDHEPPLSWGGVAMRIAGMMLGSALEELSAMRRDFDPGHGEPVRDLRAQQIWAYARHVQAGQPTVDEWAWCARAGARWSGASPFGLENMAGTICEMTDDTRHDEREDDPFTNKAWVKVAMDPEGRLENHEYTSSRSSMKGMGFRCVIRVAQLRERARAAL